MNSIRSPLVSLVILAVALRSEPSVAQPGVKADFYGFIKGSYHYSSDSVASFGADSVQAPTETQNLALTTATQTSEYKRHSKNAFQAAQSRFGFRLSSGPELGGNFEFDLVDFTNNPIGKNDARVRIAEINYRFNEKWRARVGQGWGTFAGTLPHTFNFVGAGYRSGSAGFLAQQAEVTHTLGDYSVSASVGYKGRNVTGYPTASGAGNALVQDVNHVGLPAFSTKVEWASEGRRAGIAAIIAQFEHDKGPLAAGDEERTESAGGKAYYAGPLGPFELRTQAYVGTNLNDLFLLTLASNSLRAPETPRRNVGEYGLFGSLSYAPEEGHEIYIGYGVADILTDPEKLGPGALVTNHSTRIGYSYALQKGLKTFVEATRFSSTYLGDVTAEPLDFDAHTVEAGLVYNF